MHYRKAFVPVLLTAATVGFGPCQAEMPLEPAPAKPLPSASVAPAIAAAPRPQQQTPAVAAAPPRKQQTPTVTVRMREHFAEADTIRRALIVNDLATAKSAAKWLASDEWTPPVRAAWKPYLATIQSSAKAVSDADGARTAALAFGQLVEGCASCHTAVGGPKLTLDSETAKDSLPAMTRHSWAVDRMWWGLFTPSDSAWLSGAAALSGTPLVASDVPEVEAMVRSVYSLAERARAADKRARAAFFGELLATCASCHERVGANLALADVGLPTAEVRH